MQKTGFVYTNSILSLVCIMAIASFFGPKAQLKEQGYLEFKTKKGGTYTLLPGKVLPIKQGVREF